MWLMGDASLRHRMDTPPHIRRRKAELTLYLWEFAREVHPLKESTSEGGWPTLVAH